MGMKSSPLKRIGKKTQAWLDAKKSLKEEFEKRGITSCEAQLPGCSGSYGLTYAHRYKRSDPRCEHIFEKVALFCLSCHQKSEYDRELTKQIFKRLRGGD